MQTACQRVRKANDDLFKLQVAAILQAGGPHTVRQTHYNLVAASFAARQQLDAQRAAAILRPVQAHVSRAQTDLLRLQVATQRLRDAKDDLARAQAAALLLTRSSGEDKLKRMLTLNQGLPWKPQVIPKLKAELLSQPAILSYRGQQNGRSVFKNVNAHIRLPHRRVRLRAVLRRLELPSRSFATAHFLTSVAGLRVEEVMSS